MKSILMTLAPIVTLACGTPDRVGKSIVSQEQNSAEEQAPEVGGNTEVAATVTEPEVQLTEKTVPKIIPTQVAPEKFGDFNSDQLIDDADFMLFKAAYGSQTGEANYHIKFDADKDGIVGLSDFNQFRKVYSSQRRFGDFNDDGLINKMDYDLFGAAYGSQSGDANYHVKFDADKDGIVGLSDLIEFRKVYPPQASFGDFNHDGSIDQQDLTLFRGAYGSKSGDSNYDIIFDADKDGIVGLSDLNEFRKLYGKKSSS